MLGSARFKHIEMCTREVCRSFRNYEEIQSAIPELEKMDVEIANLRAQLESLNPSPSPSQTDSGQDATTISNSSPKAQDYSKLLDPLDLPKTKRLLLARQNTLKAVRNLIATAKLK